MKRVYKHKASFAADTKYVLDRKNKKLSLASIESLKSLLPDNYDDQDLLPFAGNACVINLINANDDGADTVAGLVIADKFKNKYVNIEHDLETVCGHSVNTAFTKYDLNYLTGKGSDLIERPSEDTLEPFNIALGGFIYKSLYPDVVNKIIEASNPENEDYLLIGISWEVEFDDYYCITGSRYLKDAEIITDPEECEKLMEYHKSGSKKHPDGKEIYRVITLSKKEDGTLDKDSINPMGIGLTVRPAGQVAGVLVPDSEFVKEAPKIEASCGHNMTKCSCGKVINQCRCMKSSENVITIDKGCPDCKKDSNNKNNISQSNKKDVKRDKSAMKKLKSLSDLKNLNDENVTEYSFANVAHVIEAAEDEAQKSTADLIAEKVKEYDAQVKAKEAEANQFKQDAQAAKEKTEALEKELDSLKQSFAELQSKAAQVEATQKFNERMNHFDSEYDLEDDDRAILAKKLQNLDDAGFESFKGEFSVFAKAKKKCAKKGAPMEEDPKKDKMGDESCASKTEVKASEALKDVEDKKEDKPINAVKAEEKEKDYKEAFSLEKGFTLNFQKR